ncbi:unnamed protein product [Rhodiola kirilowii]
MDEDVFELFSKVEINIPLLEAIKQIPRYAKFLKELCTNRRRSTRYDQELMSRNVSAIIQRKVPPQMCGFIRLKMENGGPTDHAPILLGRSFLKTSKMKIDCGSGMLSMEVEGEVFSFDIFGAMKHPMEFEEVHALDTMDDLVQEVQQEPRADPLEAILNGAESSYKLTEGLHETVAHLTISEPLTPDYEVNEVKLFKSNTFLPSVIQAPKIELKPLPGHLKYAFLGENNTLSVIIKSGLEAGQEHRLVKVLRQHKISIGWTLADLRGVSPAVCMHRLLLEDGAKPSREPQRRLMDHNCMNHKHS